MAQFPGTDADETFNGDPDHRNFAHMGGGKDRVYGGDLIDTIFGDAGVDLLYGGGGDDLLAGGGGDDGLAGGSGIDVLDGGTGDDTLDLAAGGQAFGGTGDDQIILRYVAGLTSEITAGSGDDLILIFAGAHGRFDGGAGQDLIGYADSIAEPGVGVVVDLLTGRGGGAAAGDIYVSIEDVYGSSFDDVLIGRSVVNTLGGGAGNDTITGGGGGDYLDVEDGIDVLDYGNSQTAVQVDLSTGAARGGDAQEDVFLNFESISGSAFADTLTGDAGSNVLRGNGGADRLFGGDDNDTLVGGNGNDRLAGGLGSDTLYGGLGANVFVFASTLDTPSAQIRDRILDFSSAERDRIDLSGIDANTAAATDQAFTFIGADRFHGNPGELRVVVNGNVSVVTGDINGDKIADFQVNVTGDPAHPLTATDFIL